MSWHRLNRGLRCCACGKPDWCLVNDYATEFLCMRVQSRDEVLMKDGSTGYVHIADGAVVKPHRVTSLKVKDPPQVDFYPIWQKLVAENNSEWRETLARELGVSYSSLVDLDSQWDARRQAWAFPMRDGRENVVGIRLRFKDGSKKAVTGSKNGLFIPLMPNTIQNKRLWLFEGPTDTAAALTLGLTAIGRPSCNAGMFDIVLFCNRRKPREVVIVADSDTPGLEGAAALSRHLPVKNCTITVPGKDMRGFLNDGGTARILESQVATTVWCLPACPENRNPATYGTVRGGL